MTNQEKIDDAKESFLNSVTAWMLDHAGSTPSDVTWEGLQHELDQLLAMPGDGKLFIVDGIVAYEGKPCESQYVVRAEDAEHAARLVKDHHGDRTGIGRLVEVTESRPIADDGKAGVQFTIIR